MFALGRNHPDVRRALNSVIDADLPNLVQMDVSVLSGLLAERLLVIRALHGEGVLRQQRRGGRRGGHQIRAQRHRPAGLVFCDHAFHGLTYGALSLNGDGVFRDGFGPLLPGVGASSVQRSRRARSGAAQARRRRLLRRADPGQGRRSCPTTDYLAGAAALCRKYGTLFVADEIQTGLGRTGKFLAVEHWGVEPDMVLLAKALSGGHVPVGAVLTRKTIFEKVFNRMDRAVVHGSTFSKNDLGMAAGLATLRVIENEGLVRNAAQMGARLLASFEEMRDRYELVKDVRGKGLMLGVEFGAPRSLKLRAAWSLLETVNAGLFCQLITIPLFKEHKVLSQVAGHGNHCVKLLPPLIIDERDCDWIISAFDAVIADSHRVPGAVWSLGKTLADHAIKARAGA